MIITPTPAFNSKLTDIIVELQQLRNHGVSGSTEPWVFYELKNLFHIVEALASARIEGNHTTLATFVEKRLDKTDTDNERLIEISNLIEALEFIDEHIATTEISAQFMYKLHEIVVKNLSTNKEGDSRPGAYRIEPRTIGNSEHVLPHPADIKDLMDELYEYINQPCDPKLDLLKIAIAHHRFVWVHPFGYSFLYTSAIYCSLSTAVISCSSPQSFLLPPIPAYKFSIFISPHFLNLYTQLRTND